MQQKLASAIYLVTSFFDDKEPLKWRLRTLSVDLVSQAIRDKSVIAREILSVIEIAKNAGLISTPNHEILVKELYKFENEVKGQFSLSLMQANSEVKNVSLPAQDLGVIKDKIENTRSEKTPNRMPLKEFGIVSVKKNKRQSIIIGLLRRKKEVMIKDITPLVSGCSEKTIQRELLGMVDAGILRKVGEKRWSRYSLA